MVIVILHAVDGQPTITSLEAITCLSEYDRLTDDAPASHQAASGVAKALTALSEQTGVPIWFLVGTTYTGVESAEDLRCAWQEWQTWRNTIPDITDREEVEEEEGERIPF